MTNKPDTSPARLKWFAEISREWMPELCDALLAIAAEKEAQAELSAQFATAEWCSDYHCAGDCGLNGHGYQHTSEKEVP